jgi:hypothetical protein
MARLKDSNTNAKVIHRRKIMGLIVIKSDKKQLLGGE